MVYFKTCHIGAVNVGGAVKAFLQVESNIFTVRAEKGVSIKMKGCAKLLCVICTCVSAFAQVCDFFFFFSFYFTHTPIISKQS